MAKLSSDIVDKAKRKSLAAKKARMGRILERPVNKQNVLLLWGSLCDKYKKPRPGLVSKKVTNMLSGFVTLCIRHDRDLAWISDLFTKMFENWDALLRITMRTGNGKKWALATHPSLVDFLICRETIMGALEGMDDPYSKTEELPEEDKEARQEEMASFIPAKVQDIGPSEKDMQAEYEAWYGIDD